MSGTREVKPSHGDSYLSFYPSPEKKPTLCFSTDVHDLKSLIDTKHLILSLHEFEVNNNLKDPAKPFFSVSRFNANDKTDSPEGSWTGEVLDGRPSALLDKLGSK